MNSILKDELGSEYELEFNKVLIYPDRSTTKLKLVPINAIANGNIFIKVKSVKRFPEYEKLKKSNENSYL
jgi:hypothetical protein